MEGGNVNLNISINMKKVISFCLSISFLLFTGCQNKKLEVRDRAYVQSALFSEKNNITITLYPFEDENKCSSGSGYTIADAVENASIFWGKDVFMGHIELLCFDKFDFTDKLESCLDDYRISPSCKLLFILSDKSITEDTDMTLLTDRLIMEEKNGSIPETDLFHILSEKKDADGSMLIPAITKNGLSMCILTDEKSYILSEKSAAGLCWLRGENYPDRISVYGENGAEDYEVYSAKTKLSAEIKDNIPHIKVRISIKGSGNSEAAKNIIKSECTEAVKDTLKTLDSDVIGFGRCLAKYCPEYYSSQDFSTAKWAAVFDFDIDFD